jgi:hypothetical protein
MIVCIVRSQNVVHILHSLEGECIFWFHNVVNMLLECSFLNFSLQNIVALGTLPVVLQEHAVIEDLLYCMEVRFTKTTFIVTGMLLQFN